MDVKSALYVVAALIVFQAAIISRDDFTMTGPGAKRRLERFVTYAMMMGGPLFLFVVFTK